MYEVAFTLFFVACGFSSLSFPGRSRATLNYPSDGQEEMPEGWPTAAPTSVGGFGAAAAAAQAS